MDVRALSIATLTHGRVLIRDAADPAAGVIVGFHGYGQNAADMMAELEKIPGADRWTLVSIQALHRFYTRGDRTVVASWMTREDRDDAIADNVGYVDAALQGIRETGRQGASAGVTERQSASDGRTERRVVFVGFSQGASMAYRAGVAGRQRPDTIVAIGGDIPPDITHIPAGRWPRIVLCAGDQDAWFRVKSDADAAFLAAHGVTHDHVVYHGAHEITDAVRQKIASLL